MASRMAADAQERVPPAWPCAFHPQALRGDKAGGPRSCAAASSSPGDAYSISILGDTHFDAAPTSLYHGKWVPRHQND